VNSCTVKNLSNLKDKEPLPQVSSFSVRLGALYGVNTFKGRSLLLAD